MYAHIYIHIVIQVFFGQLYVLSYDVVQMFATMFAFIGLCSMGQGVIGIIGIIVKDKNAFRIVSSSQWEVGACAGVIGVT